MYLSTKQVIQESGLCRSKVFELFNRADFPTIRIGKRLLVEENDFHEWMSLQKDTVQKERYAE